MRNGNFRGQLDDLPIEPTAREQSRRLRATATPQDDPRRPLTLRLETGERVLDQLDIDPVPAQVEADGGIPLAAFGERPSPPARETLVVEQADSAQLGDGLLELAGLDARTRETLAQPAF
jgi:hypothetical protein